MSELQLMGHGVETARPPSASHPPEVPVSLADRVVAAVRARPGRSCTAVAEELHAWPSQVAKVSRTDPRIRREARPRSNACDLYPAELPSPSLLSPPSPLDLPGESTAASGGGLPSPPSSDTPPAPTDAGAGSDSPAGTSGGDLVDDTPLRPAGLPSPEVAPVPVPDPRPVPPPGGDVCRGIHGALGEDVRVGELEAQVRTLQLELDAARQRADNSAALLRWGGKIAAVLLELAVELRAPWKIDRDVEAWARRGGAARAPWPRRGRGAAAASGVLAEQERELDAFRATALERIQMLRADRAALRVALKELGDDNPIFGGEASVKAAVLRIREPLEAALGAPARALTLASLADEAERVIGELRTRAEQQPTVDEVALELLSELRDRAEASGLRVPRSWNAAVLIAYLTGWLEASGSITAPVPPLAPVSVIDGAPVSAGA